MDFHSMRRRSFLRAMSSSAGFFALSRGQGVVPTRPEDFPQLQPRHENGQLRPLIHAPQQPEEWPEWRRQLVEWREAARRGIAYDDSLYRREDLRWASRCFTCGFVMMCDETFYDPGAGRFTVENFLEEGKRTFGGYDAIVLWHAYPRIGFDDRNQFDFYRDMPGGLSGLRALSHGCHRLGVRIFVNYNPWDTGTRRELRSDMDALADLVNAIEADGIFLDTLHQGAAEFRTRLDASRLGVVLESELELPLDGVADHHLSWAQWFDDSPVPGILRNQWFERRHRMHQIKRWHRDHTGELHTAWMNGGGMLIWENVFGSWIGWNEWDRSLLRTIVPIQRRYASLFLGDNWIPLVPTLQNHLYASQWDADGLRLWTLVNRAEQSVEGDLLRVTTVVEARWYDLVAGTEIHPQIVEGHATLYGRLGPRGMGCFLARPMQQWDGEDEMAAFLAIQREAFERATADTSFPYREIELRPGAVVPSATSVPDGMVEIPATRTTLVVEYRSRECGFYENTPPAGNLWGWAPLHEPRQIRRVVMLHRYAMDLTPVTNAAFARFLSASRYRPRHPERFLAHWSHQTPPQGLEEHPVVFVSLEDARAYAAWAGKRLPTEDEWQYAAAGPEAWPYPWGHQRRERVCNDGRTGGTTPVSAFPDGRSPFGLFDCCGNIWQWTDSERSDGRTRFCFLKGGSFYAAHGSDWYADGGLQTCRFAAKFLLMWPGLDRCGTIGFRCAVGLK